MTGRRVLGVALLAALALGACGDDDDDDGVPSGAKGRVIREADAICAETDAKVEALGTGDNNAPEFIEKSLPILKEGLQEIREIDVPGEDEETFDLFVAYSTNVVQSTEAALFAHQGNDPAKASAALEAAEEASIKALQAAKEYGFVECAKA